MARARNKSWTEIIPDENLPALRWFYTELLPSLLLLESPFWHPNHEQLVRDWNYPSWLQYNREFPKGLLVRLRLFLDVNYIIQAWRKVAD